MSQLIYTPKVLEDLQAVKNYLARQFGTDKAKIGVEEITSTVRQLKHFPEEGPHLGELIGYPTDYRYLVVKPNYVFVVSKEILNEGQDFLQMIFGVSSISEEGEEYWSRLEDDR